MANTHVVRHMKDVINREVKNCQGGEGSIFVRQILGYDLNLPISGFQGDSEAFHFIHITTLPKGSSVGEHHHIGNEEIYLVIKGVGEMVVDGDKYVMKPGSIGLVKDGAAHSMKNIGDEELQMLVVEVELK